MNSKIEFFGKLVEDELYNYFADKRDEYKLVFDAMEYSVKNGGKRVRPLLVLLFCDACGGDVKNAVPLAVAVEYIHTYSLIHDDLPCMDNDDFRRGKPSNHKVYGEANALLAGDGLLTAAFEVIAKGAADGKYGYDVASKATLCLAELAGCRGMIGGQVIDLASEGKSIGIETLTLLDELKTATLIKAACTLGCIAAGANGEYIAAAAEFAYNLGIAFQIKDDILDIESSQEVLGKPTGSDEKNCKSTYTALLGIEKCRQYVYELTEKATAALNTFEDNEALKEYADFLADRIK